jgi:hypothetical protein
MEPKTCPHCQSDKFLCVSSHSEIESDNDDADNDEFAVLCNHIHGGCGATGGFRPNEKDAILAWNTGLRRVDISIVTNPDE